VVAVLVGSHVPPEGTSPPTEANGPETAVASSAVTDSPHEVGKSTSRNRFMFAGSTEFATTISPKPVGDCDSRKIVPEDPERDETLTTA
jgi:hypothetical protein